MSLKACRHGQRRCRRQQWDLEEQVWVEEQVRCFLVRAMAALNRRGFLPSPWFYVKDCWPGLRTCWRWCVSALSLRGNIGKRFERRKEAAPACRFVALMQHSESRLSPLLEHSGICLCFASSSLSVSLDVRLQCLLTDSSCEINWGFFFAC